MTFDRHEILKAHYAQEMREWKWAKIKEQCANNTEPCDYGSDDMIGYCLVGTVFGCTPSGKVYTFWTSNQTRSDETRDTAWWDAIEMVKRITFRYRLLYAFHLLVGESNSSD